MQAKGEGDGYCGEGKNGVVKDGGNEITDWGQGGRDLGYVV